MSGEINPKEIQVNFTSLVIPNGSVDIAGWGDGVFLTIDYNSPGWNMFTGADGETARVRTNDNSALMTLGIMQTEESNDVLSLITNIDLISGKGAIRVLVKDAWGKTVNVAPVCCATVNIPVFFQYSSIGREIPAGLSPMITVAPIFCIISTKTFIIVGCVVTALYGSFADNKFGLI